MISLDYDDTLQAAAGFQVEEIRKKIMKDHKGGYILAVEGNAPTKDGGVYCTVGGRDVLDILQETAADAKAVVAWGSCASNGCVQAAHPNPTGAKPITQLISRQADHQCSRLPADRRSDDRRAHLHPHVRSAARTRSQRPPKMFYGQRIHDKCYRRRLLRRRPVRGSMGRRRARARAGASTRWAAAVRPPTIPAPP